MALVRNRRPYAIDLSSGATVAPGGQVNADVSLPRESAYLTEGLLLLVDGSVAPPPPETFDTSMLRARVPWSERALPFLIDVAAGTPGTHAIGVDGLPIAVAGEAGALAAQVAALQTAVADKADATPRTVAPVSLNTTASLDMLGEREVLFGPTTLNHAHGTLSILNPPASGPSKVRLLVVQDATGGRRLSVSVGGQTVEVTDLLNAAPLVRSRLLVETGDGADWTVSAG